MLTSHHTQNESTQEEERQGDDRFTQLHQVLPPEVLTLSGVFPVAPNIHLTPFAEAQREERLRLLLAYLPPENEAAELRHIYFQHAAWM